MTAWNDSDFYNHPHTVTPFEPANVNPASYDLRLGDTLRRVHPIWGRLTADDLQRLCDGKGLLYAAAQMLTDAETGRYQGQQGPTPARGER